MPIAIENEPALPRFVDMQELSRRLCLKKSALYEIFQRGELTLVKLGRRKSVVLESELQEFIQRKFAEARREAA